MRYIIIIWYMIYHLFMYVYQVVTTSSILTLEILM